MIIQDRFIIETTGLNKSFKDHTVLKDIDLRVKKGERIVILGASGCGKSTLLKCLNGLEKPDQGSILFEGRSIDPDSKSIHQIRQDIGMVFQSYDLFPHLNVLDNLTIAPMKVQKRSSEEARKNALSLLTRFGLSERADAFPRHLSGGQKQRVAIIRALCMEPRIMLFDEVTASLDPGMVQEVLAVLTELAKQGLTMLIVTHELAFARSVADRIIFMDSGRIIESASPEEFFNQPKTEEVKAFLKHYRQKYD